MTMECRRGNKCLLYVLSLLSLTNLLAFVLFADYWRASHWAPRHHPQPTDNRIDHRTEPPPTTPHEEDIHELLDVLSGLFSDRKSSSSSSIPATKSGKPGALKAPRLDRLWNVWNISFPIDKPELCHSPKAGERNTSVVIVVVSAIGNVAARDAIRETWGRALLAHAQVRLVFLVGRPPKPRESNTEDVEDADSDLSSEDERHGDIVQADFTEDYRNLTLKSVLLLRWVRMRCPDTRFVVKVDDDVFVNPVNLLALLERHRRLKKRIFGRLAVRWRPIRDRRSHYFVDHSVWTSPVYPNFVAGPAYGLTGDAIGPLLAQVSSVPFFFLEDVYVTGMCAQTAGVRRLNHDAFRNQRTTLNPCLFHKLISSHRVDPERMRRAWLLLDRYGPDSDECWEQRCSFSFLGLCVDGGKVAVDFDKKNNASQHLVSTPESN